MDRERVGVKPGINILPSPAESVATASGRIRHMYRPGSEDWFVARYREYLKMPKGNPLHDRRAVDYLYYTMKKHAEYLESQGFGE